MTGGGGPVSDGLVDDSKDSFHSESHAESDAKADKKDEPTKQGRKNEVEDLPVGAKGKDKTIKGGGGGTPTDQVSLNW